jgi:hypothetical protein
LHEWLLGQNFGHKPFSLDVFIFCRVNWCFSVIDLV